MSKGTHNIEKEGPLFFALGDPFRRDLLHNLAENSPRTATQLADEYPITRQGILKHLDVLEAAGLVKVEQHGREKRYSLSLQPLTEVEQWIQKLNDRWDARLMRLKTMLESELDDE